MSGKAQDKTGLRFGRLVVIERAETHISPSGKRRTMWKCRCDCGNIVIVRSDGLSSGRTKSCGCYQKERTAEAGKIKTHKIKYGDSAGRLYNIWYLMRYRCNNPKCHAYHNYGGRGISICTDWNDNDTGYLAFKQWALDSGYTDSLSLDRIDNNGNYEPNNCRWADAFVQGNNKRNSAYLVYNGEKHTISQWARIIGMDMRTLHNRIKLGWKVEDALFRPLRKSNNTNKTDG